MLFAQYRCSNRCDATQQYQSVRCAIETVQRAIDATTHVSRLTRVASTKLCAGFLLDLSESDGRLLTITSITADREAARAR